MIPVLGNIICAVRGHHEFGAKDRGRYGRGGDRRLFKGKRCRTCGTLGVKKTPEGFPTNTKGIAIIV